MQQFKTIIGIFTTLLFSILTVTAQDFDPKQGYEIHTVSGLALDNQESLDTNSNVFISKREENKESQVWNIIPTEREGYYMISSPLTELSIDNSGNVLKNVLLSNGIRITKILTNNGK